MVLRRNVLVFHAGALGDFVLTWPLVMALGRLFPQSRIICVTHGQKGALAERVLRVESADIEAGWHHLLSNPDQLPDKARKLLAGAHSVFSFIARPGEAWLDNVRQFSPDGLLLTLEPKPPADYPRHATDYLLDQLQAWPAGREAMRQIRQFIDQRGLSACHSANGPVLVHPGSGSRDKCWPMEHFVALIQRIKRDGLPVRIVVGEAEAERWTAGELDHLSAEAEVLRPATYLDLLKQLSEASAVVANDSGPGHLAGVLGVPTVSLFGPTDPAVWRPLGPRVQVLRGQPLQAIEVDAVYQAVLRARG